MTFQNLDYFIATATEQSFTRAAAKLFITQQSLSGQIAAMERELGCQLFVRTKPLQLTKAGKLLYNYSTEIMREYRKMKNDMKLMARQTPGELTIGISFAGAIPPLKNLISEYLKVKPGIRIRVLEMPEGDMIERLRDGTVDFAITHFPEHDPAFIRFEIFEDEIVLLVATELLDACFGENREAVVREIVTKGDYSLLKACPYIHSRRNNIVSRFAERFMGEYIPTPLVSAESDSLETLMELCKSSVGFSFFPRSITRDMLNEEELKKLQVFRLGESAKFTMHYGYLKDAPRNESFRKFLEVMDKLRP